MKRENSFLNISIDRDEEESIALISIDGMIGEDPFSPEEEQNTSSNMREKLKEIAELEVDEIQVNINSLGGSVDDGLAIHDLLKENPAKVKTKIQGMSASSATIIFQAGDVREISTNAMMLIHRAWTMGLGNTNDFKSLSENLEKTDGVISNIYAKRGGKDPEFYLDLMSENGGDGRWLDADEAVEFGLVDKAVEPAYKKVAMDKSAFDNLGLPVPKNLKEVEQDSDSDEQSLNNDEQISSESDTEKEIQEELTNKENGDMGSSRERALTLLKLKQEEDG